MKAIIINILSLQIKSIDSNYVVFVINFNCVKQFEKSIVKASLLLAAVFLSLIKCLGCFIKNFKEVTFRNVLLYSQTLTSTVISVCRHSNIKCVADLSGGKKNSISTFLFLLLPQIM